MENGRVTSLQMALMMYAVILATAFISIPAISARQAGNDFWMTPIVAAVSGIISIYLAYQLHRLYPGHNPVQYAERILGRIAGKIAGVLLFEFLVQVCGLVARQFAEFVTGSYLFKTPLLFLIIVIVLLAAFAVRGGIEVIGRSAVILTPIFALPLLFLLLLLQDFDFGNILPVWSQGIGPIMKGSTVPIAWYSEFFLIAFFLPRLTDPEKARSLSLISLAAVVLSLTFVNLVTLLSFGADVEDKTYPILTAFRYISRADFFENLEALLLAMWVVGNFIKLAVVFYSAVISLGTCLDASDYRPYVFPVSTLCIIYSIWGHPSFFSVSDWVMTVAAFQIPSYLLLFPLLLLIVALLRRRRASST